MTEAVHSPVLLDTTHDRAGFDCGKNPLNEFLIKCALQNHIGGATRTYVALRGPRVVGYYSLAPGSVSPEDAPGRVTQGQGKYPVPVILMARFAVDLSEQGKGLGAALFRDALRRAITGAIVIGGCAFVVHAKDDDARRFYLRFGMVGSPTDPHQLFLLMKDVRQYLARSGQ